MAADLSAAGAVPDTSARRARADDVATLHSLTALAREVVAGARGGALWNAHDAWRLPVPIEDLLADDTALVAAGTLDEHVVGYLLGVIDTLHDGRRVGRVAELLVLPEARTLGVGEALIAMAIEWAEASGCVGIDSEALPGDRDTKNFFESAGLVARAILVHRPLGEGAT